MLTGRDQDHCGAWSNNAIFPPDLPSLPGYLAERAGYETALVGKMHFGGSRQFNGFRRRPYGDYATVNAGQEGPTNADPEHESCLRRASEASRQPIRRGEEPYVTMASLCDGSGGRRPRSQVSERPGRSPRISDETRAPRVVGGN